jgi:hypothetical protein
MFDCEVEVDVVAITERLSSICGRFCDKCVRAVVPDTSGIDVWVILLDWQITTSLIRGPEVITSLPSSYRLEEERVTKQSPSDRAFSIEAPGLSW